MHAFWGPSGLMDKYKSNPRCAKCGKFHEWRLTWAHRAQGVIWKEWLISCMSDWGWVSLHLQGPKEAAKRKTTMEDGDRKWDQLQGISLDKITAVLFGVLRGFMEDLTSWWERRSNTAFQSEWTGMSTIYTALLLTFHGKWNHLAKVVSNWILITLRLKCWLNTGSNWALRY